VKAVIASGVAGVVFSLGLGLAGMTDPANVQGFLDFTGDWRPALAFVMGGAIAVHGLSRFLVMRRRAPLLEPSFSVPSPSAVDARLLVGSALFGVGWGLSGYCPGPAFTSLAAGTVDALTFVAAMLGGMRLFAAVEARRAAGAKAEVEDAPGQGEPVDA
jgi:uncharacterized membrane protein YedE/YeeE